MSSLFTSTKIIPLGSCAFRQPYATSHCRYIHGYRLQAKFWFACNSLDKNNWVVDFGSLKPLKNILEEQFDHTTVVWTEDPDLQTFIELNKKNIIDLRIMKEGVGIEMFAKYCADKANEFVKNLTNNRCWVEKVEVWEHEQNSAVYTPLQPGSTTLSWGMLNDVNTSNIVPFSNTSTFKVETPTTDETVTTAVTPPPLTTMTSAETEANIAAKSVVNSFIQPNSPPLYGTKSTGYSNPFKGTSWDNNAGPKR
jgi:6-pyruvoyltetrahydropterin/6-carboxytetrahydropterin synthase